MPAVGDLQQLLTFHGTIVFLDIESGELRHGQAASSPRNVFLAQREGVGHLVHAPAAGELRDIRLAPGLPPTPVQLDDAPSDSAQAWSLPPAEYGAVGLLCDGLYLCAEPDGRVTLSRPQFGVWERFLLLDEQSSTKNILFLQTAEATYRQMLESTSQTVREYCSRHRCRYESFFGIVRGYYPWHAVFNRIPLLKRLLDTGYSGWVCYLDADAYVADLDFDLRDYLSNKDDFALIIAPGGPSADWWNVNDGVFLINLTHPVGQAIVHEWSRQFDEITDDQLRAATVWLADDQNLLWQALQTIPGAERSTLVLKESPGLLNYMDGLFIRQILRTVGSVEKRTDLLKIEVTKLLGDNAWIAPDAPRPFADRETQGASMPAVGGLQQLLTFHGTVVFLDIGSGELRHGQAASSPRNVFFALREGAGHLVHAPADGGLRDIRVAPGLPPTPVQLHDLPSDSPQAWSVTPAEGCAVGLLCDGQYLCAEPDGHVTLSRQQLGAWEQFVFLDELSPKLNVLFLQTADATYRHMLELTSQTVREYCTRHEFSYESFFGIIRGYYPWQATYNRLQLLKRLVDIGYCGWVCYLDADAYVADLDFDLREYLSDKGDFALIIAPGAPSSYWWNINAGVFLINLTHPVGQAIVRDWFRRFDEITDGQLRAWTVWPQSGGDQLLLAGALKSVPGAERSTLVLKESPGLLNYMDGLFIKQVLRSVGDLEKRMAFLKMQVEKLLGNNVEAPTGASKPTEDQIYEAFVRALYRVLLLRDPDPGGLINGMMTMQTGASFEDEMRKCLQSGEFAAKHRQFIETYVRDEMLIPMASPGPGDCQSALAAADMHANPPPAGIQPKQMLTSHGTMVFADGTSGQLRHGPRASSPANVFLVVNGQVASLLRRGPDGTQHPISVRPAVDLSQASGAAHDDDAPADAFHAVDASGSAFGLMRDGLFLCAEADGRVTLSRQQLGPWEQFYPSEASALMRDPRMGADASVAEAGPQTVT